MERRRNLIEIGEIIEIKMLNLGTIDIRTFADNQKAICTCNVSAGELDYVSVFPIAVRYLGNGYFEEIITGERIVSYNRVASTQLVDGGYYGINNEIDAFEDLWYNDYQIAWNFDYNKCLENYNFFEDLINNNIKCPLILEYFNVNLKLDDKQVLDYQSRFVELRREFITELKKDASIKAITAKENFQTLMASMKENLDMAYLENQLFDFERKGRTK